MGKWLRRAVVFLLIVVVAAGAWFGLETQPSGSPKPTFIRYERPKTLLGVLNYLEHEGFIRSANATALLALFKHRTRHVAAGTYELSPEMSSTQILAALSRPIRQPVRLPETNWARRSANLLEMADVCTADDYLALVSTPSEFKPAVDFPLEEPTLEGYLFPDTYDLPPLLGARAVVERQLEAFDRKVWKPLHPKDLKRVLIVASIVELETRLDSERPVVAGVIENRLAQGMPLQIDATVLYARQKWGLLTHKEIKETDSEYNTYRKKGLPPGPICSPSVKSIEAAMQPAKHDYIYYVAMPDGHQIFAKTYEEHLHNIGLRKQALAALAKRPL